MQSQQYNARQRGASRLVVIGCALVAMLLLAGISYGPEVLGYYRFVQAVDQASSQSEAAGGPWPQLSDTCMPCHGYDGNTLTQLYPRLAGQPAQYLREQLIAFADGRRSNAIMSPLALSLSSTDIDALAAFYAARPAAENVSFVPDPQHRERGARLVGENACAACHGQDQAGQMVFPRLAGQGYDYLVVRMHRFRSDALSDNAGVMGPIAAPLTDQEIIDMASYLASYPGVNLEH